MSLESKTKFSSKDALGGYEGEVKLKNNGEISTDFKSDYLKVSHWHLGQDGVTRNPEPFIYAHCSQW